MKFSILTLAVLAILLLVSFPARAEALMTVRLVIEPDRSGTDLSGTGRNGGGRNGAGSNQEEVLIDLLDNPAAKAFAAQLPLTLAFRDYAGEEKIATLPTRLSAKASPSARDLPVDFTYFIPWGNLAVFYNGQGTDGQLLALGRIRTGKAVLARQHTDFTARLEPVDH